MHKLTSYLQCKSDVVLLCPSFINTTRELEFCECILLKMKSLLLIVTKGILLTTSKRSMLRVILNLYMVDSAHYR